VSNNQSALSDEERAELEALRAAKRASDDAERQRQERAELENLRKSQKYAQEDAEYYAEKARKKAEREYAREHPDYGLDDIEPMSTKQKIVIAVIVVMAIILVAYLVVFNLNK
jgi:SpoVK/Ycf46/Vps4 family AAA+-type ATPase